MSPTLDATGLKRRALLAAIAAASVAPALSASTTGAAELLVADQRGHRLLVVEAATGRLLRAIEVGINGHEVALSPDQRLAYVTIYSDASLGQPGLNGSVIDVVDLVERRRVAGIEVGPVRPHGLAVLPDGRLLFTAELKNAVGVLDTARPGDIRWLPTGRTQSHMLAYSTALDRVFTANVDSGSISAIDLASGKLLEVAQISSKLQRVTASADGLSIFTHDLARPRLVALDARTLQGTREIALPGLAYASACLGTGKLLVALPFGHAAWGTRGAPGALCVVDLAAARVEKVLPVAGLPSAIVVSPDGRSVFVSLFDTGEILVFDAASETESRRIQLSPGADGMALRTAQASR